MRITVYHCYYYYIIKQVIDVYTLYIHIGVYLHQQTNTPFSSSSSHRFFFFLFLLHRFVTIRDLRREPRRSETHLFRDREQTIWFVKRGQCPAFLVTLLLTTTTRSNWWVPLDIILLVNLYGGLTFESHQQHIKN